MYFDEHRYSKYVCNKLEINAECFRTLKIVLNIPKCSKVFENTRKYARPLIESTECYGMLDNLLEYYIECSKMF